MFLLLLTTIAIMSLLTAVFRASWWFVKLVCVLCLVFAIAALALWLLKILAIVVLILIVPIGILVIVSNRKDRQYHARFEANRERYRQEHGDYRDKF